MGFVAEFDGDGFWIHDDESGEVEHVIRFVQAFLRRFRPDAMVGFEWSNDCSKPRLDAYGGGAVLITQFSADYVNTGAWLARQMELERGLRSVASA